MRVFLRLCEDFFFVLLFCLLRQINTRFTDNVQMSSIFSTDSRVASLCHGMFSSHSKRRVLSQIGAVIAEGDGSSTDVVASTGRETRSHSSRNVCTLFGDQRIALVRYNLRSAFAFGILLYFMKQRINEWPNSSFWFAPRDLQR